MILLSAFFFLLHLSVLTTTIAFAPVSCRTSRSNTCTIDVLQKGQEQRYWQNYLRGPFVLPILEATQIDQDPLFGRPWYPEDNVDHFSREDLEETSLQLMAELIRPLLSRGVKVEDREKKEIFGDHTENEIYVEANQLSYGLAKGRFVDFCGEKEGEERIESFFLHASNTKVGREIIQSETNNDLGRYQKVVEGAIVSLQSLLVIGMTYGLTLHPMGVSRAVAHMKEDAEALDATWATHGEQWTPAHSLRLKFLCFSDHDADVKVSGLRLLSTLKWKRSPLRAYELLVQIGAWGKHESLTMLRNGMPLRFTEIEEEAANEVAKESDNSQTDDPDTTLGIRRDFRPQKVYTIDSASTKEIDDGLGVEIVDGDSDKKRYRYWIHIADADRWAKRNSELFEMAKRRVTSIYLPGRSIPMIPASVSQQVMSLRAQTDVCALSLGVELNDDGSIVEDSIVVTPSTVRVTYRLTYDDADEMLADGVGYSEEWQLGQLYTAAQQRRQFRIHNGSSEDFVPTQIPQYTISTFPDREVRDEVGIKVDVQVSHNSGKNQSSIVTESGDQGSSPSDELPVSSSFLLVTEMMILAGEAIGKWAVRETQSSDDDPKTNPLELPFRSQEQPDYRGRERERDIMTDLLECNIGDGYCHAWYSRRFFSPAKVTRDALPHTGLGLGCYVQWTSPIRRFQDLQVHAAVKRFIRRQKVIELVKKGEQIPNEITSDDLGCELPSLNEDGKLELSLEDVDKDINYNEKTSLLKPAQFVMRSSNKFWMLEYIRRLKEDDPKRSVEVLVLGCVNPSKRQYAVYVYDFGLEWRYNSPCGIQAGDRFRVQFGNVLPQNGQMTLIRMVNGSK
eukprot:CAMPEP_0168188690 /NCGR_PEP_ID=MMETSP0139_2-20121125/15853_1 /TAXON_ID=44445 /ORGANISM="Pseudo-nitzschia australis, Strain 10249 10 AB" /LENGTH=845 /DNA_ID=CAMNT_0008111287 /DNA_START=283 /DNA_END=2820 /DNA_ORIENTATION=-